MMPSRMLVLMSGLIFSVAATAIGGNAQTKDGAKPLPLELTVRIDRTTYHLSDSIKLETQITNVSSTEWYLYEWDLCWNSARGLVIHAIDAAGELAQTEFLIDCVPPPPQTGNVYQFMKLGAGRFYGLQEQFPVKELVAKEGEYDIQVTYESAISKSWISEFFANEPIGKLPLWTMEQPVLRANRIHIRVVK